MPSPLPLGGEQAGRYHRPGAGFLEPGPDGSYALVSEMGACAKVLALTAFDIGSCPK